MQSLIIKLLSLAYTYSTLKGNYLYIYRSYPNYSLSPFHPDLFEYLPALDKRNELL